MTLFLSAADVAAVATHDVAMAAARAAIDAERHGRTVVPRRLDVPHEYGFLRVMPAGLGSVMGLKVMTLVEGLGTRYLLLMYRVETGELVAVLDAEEVTRLRTAAITAVAGQMLAPELPATIGLLGSGFEAEGHLRLLARVWPLRDVLVFSPSPERRAVFAQRMADELGVAVTTCASADEAIADMSVSVLATKSTEPVVDGGSFAEGAVVLSIGSTRPDLRELDRATLRRSGTLLVDDVRQIATESGDVIDALESGAIDAERIVSMAQCVSDPERIGRSDGRDLLAFKSVGTAVQDLALARAAVDAAIAAGHGREIGELARLKRFAAVAAEQVRAAGGSAP